MKLLLFLLLNSLPTSPAPIKLAPTHIQKSHVYVAQTNKLKFTASAGFNKYVVHAVDVDAMLDGNLSQAFYGISPVNVVRWDVRLKYRFNPKFSITARWLEQNPKTSYVLSLAFHNKTQKRNIPKEL